MINIINYVIETVRFFSTNLYFTDFWNPNEVLSSIISFRFTQVALFEKPQYLEDFLKQHHHQISNKTYSNVFREEFDKGTDLTPYLKYADKIDNTIYNDVLKEEFDNGRDLAPYLKYPDKIDNEIYSYLFLELVECGYNISLYGSQCENKRESAKVFIEKGLNKINSHQYSNAFAFMIFVGISRFAKYLLQQDPEKIALSTYRFPFDSYQEPYKDVAKYILIHHPDKIWQSMEDGWFSSIPREKAKKIFDFLYYSYLQAGNNNFYDVDLKVCFDPVDLKVCFNPEYINLDILVAKQMDDTHMDL